MSPNADDRCAARRHSRSRLLRFLHRLCFCRRVRLRRSGSGERSGEHNGPVGAGVSSSDLNSKLMDWTGTSLMETSIEIGSLSTDSIFTGLEEEESAELGIECRMHDVRAELRDAEMSGM